jgi:hypothetical protein
MKAQNASLAQDTSSAFEMGSAVAGLAAVMPAPLPIADPRPGRSGSSRRRRTGEAGPKDSATPFGPDVILPEQFYDQSAGIEQVSGERALMLAVLEDGIRCFQEHLRNPRVRPRLLARQAEKWIRSDDWEWPFSFNNVCESLSLNPDSLRVELLNPRSMDAPPKPRPSTHRVYRLTPRVKPPRRR